MKVKRKILEEIVNALSSTKGYITDQGGGQFTGGYYEGHLKTTNGLLTFAFTNEGLYDITFEDNKQLEQKLANQAKFQAALTGLIKTKVQNANSKASS